MKPNWKEMLLFLNTAFISGLIFYCRHADLNGAAICTLATFILALSIYLLFSSISKNGQRKR